MVTEYRSGSLSFERPQTCSLMEKEGGKTPREKAIFDTGKQVGRDFFFQLYLVIYGYFNSNHNCFSSR